MSRGSLTFLTVKGALLAAIPALLAPQDGPHLFALTVLALTLAATLVLRKRYG